MIEPIKVLKFSPLDQPFNWFYSILCLDTRNLLVLVLAEVLMVMV